MLSASSFRRFFFSHPAPTATYTLSLHDALPIFRRGRSRRGRAGQAGAGPGKRDYAIIVLVTRLGLRGVEDRKSTRLNSSHVAISYAVFCLKKKTMSRFPRRLSIRPS